jgi:hypothetical protein
VPRISGTLQLGPAHPGAQVHRCTAGEHMKCSPKPTQPPSELHVQFRSTVQGAIDSGSTWDAAHSASGAVLPSVLRQDTFLKAWPWPLGPLHDAGTKRPSELVVPHADHALTLHAVRSPMHGKRLQGR